MNSLEQLCSLNLQAGCLDPCAWRCRACEGLASELFAPERGEEGGESLRQLGSRRTERRALRTERSAWLRFVPRDATGLRQFRSSARASMTDDSRRTRQHVAWRSTIPFSSTRIPRSSNVSLRPPEGFSEGSIVRANRTNKFVHDGRLSSRIFGLRRECLRESERCETKSRDDAIYLSSRWREEQRRSSDDWRIKRSNSVDREGGRGNLKSWESSLGLDAEG